MSGSDDPYISFGRCYFDDGGEEAPDRFIPCGNVNFGNVTCCQSEDMCLSSNACYNPQYGMTYVAGCTDESYEDDSCPPKGAYASDAWVGATYCNGTSNEWVLCENNRSPSTVTTTNGCWCPETSRTVGFEDASVLANVVSLPSATGASLDWQGGFLPNTESATTSGSNGESSESSPATTSAETTTSSTEINGTPSTTTIISTPTIVGDRAANNNDGSGGGGLSTGAKIGIGVGVGLGFLAFIALLVFALLRRRRRHEGSPSFEKLTKPSPQQEAAYPSGQTAQQGRFYDNHSSAPPAFGHKSELDAVDTAATAPSPRQDSFDRPVSEIEGSPAQGSDGRPLQDGGWEMPGQMGTIYEKP